ncbi:peptidylprolyl isomerase [Paenibacillus sabinae]|uniref:peptidylprolyl isomerase n=1 Tax=Paenibacillus sabinae T27 TaxID=1268072 RepID=X4ZDX9_9BACL|nr:peptidylprolyl isomerase [Paenibacillus sabinae]AHV95005.1 PpiC-type peptidyl-prolyl cis-trans isomerase [Paenibacillus sabinae T27]
MTRQERALRKAVLVLAGFILLLAVVLLREWRKEQGTERDDEGEKTIAKVAGQSISLRQWQDELQKKHGDEVLLAMLNRIAVGAEAKRLGISISDQEVDRELETAASGYGSKEQYYAQMESELGLTKEEVREETAYRLTLQAVATAGIIITDKEIDEYIRQNPDRFRPVKEIGLSIIKVHTYMEAEQALDRIESGEDFAALAQEISIDEDSRIHGGRVGTVEDNDPFWPQELLKAAAGLSPGDVAGPFQVEGGYAVIQTDRVTAPPMPDDQEIRDQVRQELALEQAPPLQQVEDNLRTKYGAAIDVDKGLQD